MNGDIVAFTAPVPSPRRIIDRLRPRILMELWVTSGSDVINRTMQPQRLRLTSGQYQKHLLENRVVELTRSQYKQFYNAQSIHLKGLRMAGVSNMKTLRKRWRYL